MKEFKRFTYHFKVMMKGLWRATCGSAIAGMIALAVYGFTNIASEDGYVAVFDFVGAVIVLGMAMLFIYTLGGGKRNKGGFER